MQRRRTRPAICIHRVGRETDEEGLVPPPYTPVRTPCSGLRHPTVFYDVPFVTLGVGVGLDDESEGGRRCR